MRNKAIGFICTSRSPKEARRNALKVLRKAGNGRVFITAHDAHLIERIIETADSKNPEYCDLYGSKNANTEAMLSRIRKQVCASCGGMGWWLADMGEGADTCLDCNGTGTKSQT